MDIFLTKTPYNSRNIKKSPLNISYKPNFQNVTHRVYKHQAKLNFKESVAHLVNNVSNISEGIEDANSLISSLRKGNREKLLKSTLPLTRDEDYRFTDFSYLFEKDVKTPDPIRIIPPDCTTTDGPNSPDYYYLVISENAISIPSLCKEDCDSGIYVGSLLDAPKQLQLDFTHRFLDPEDEEDERVAAAAASSSSSPFPSPPIRNFFELLNGATAGSPVIAVHVPASITARKPLYIMYMGPTGPSSPSVSPVMTSSFPRVLISLAPGASLELVEEFVSGGACGFTNSVLDASCASHATLCHSYVQHEHLDSVHVKSTTVRQDESSSYSLTEACTGARISRHDLKILQHGPSTSTQLRQALLSGPSQLLDSCVHLRLRHPEARAEQVHRVVLCSPSSRTVFRGTIEVLKTAQRTDARQLSRALLLAPRAVATAVPGLRINADDVKCAHGCSVSAVSNEELFYLRARGIPATMATEALVRSFATDVISALRPPALAVAVRRSLIAKLEARGQEVGKVEDEKNGEQERA
mmetsp:Transcript_29435/g.54015  ORF Transcript_29435/g.54015 Transcript_29435/m.54015 type:complete len:526 (-) Transcript_29435:532-2109(-)